VLDKPPNPITVSRYGDRQQHTLEAIVLPTADLPLFRIKDHRPGLAILVCLPARRCRAVADGRRYTNMYE
jgi:hypothetical protein